MQLKNSINEIKTLTTELTEKHDGESEDMLKPLYTARRWLQHYVEANTSRVFRCECREGIWNVFLQGPKFI
jgi:hypothetical protein